MSEEKCSCKKRPERKKMSKLKGFKTSNGKSVYLGSKGGIYVKGKNGMYSASAKTKRQVITSHGNKILDKLL